jgi:hypothetical protein
VLAANLWQTDESASSELASSLDILEACMLQMRVGGLPPLECPGVPWGCGVTPHLGIMTGAAAALLPVVLGVVACVSCGLHQGGCWLPLKLRTAPPASTIQVGVAGSTHGGHQHPPHAWRHSLLGLGFVATLPAVRMTGAVPTPLGDRALGRVALHDGCTPHTWRSDGCASHMLTTSWWVAGGLAVSWAGNAQVAAHP